MPKEKMTNELKIARPAADEFDSYYERYVSLVAGENVLAALENQISETVELLGSIDEAKADFRYASGKWSVKELLGHVIDTERIFAYRALRIARNDATAIEGYEQDGYVENADFGACDLADLAKEFSLVRESNLCLFRNLPPAAWTRSGTANGKRISVRALAYILAGHEIYHVNILRDRYLA